MRPLRSATFERILELLSAIRGGVRMQALPTRIEVEPQLRSLDP